MTNKQQCLLHSIRTKQKIFNQRVYSKGTKVLHRFRDCGIGTVIWANDRMIAVAFENGEDSAYYVEEIKRLEYPI